MSPAPGSAHWHGVIDIGSNSVRLVIYDVYGRALLPHYNEKVMAGLGEGLAETGHLSTTGRATAAKALARFKAVLDGLAVKPARVRGVATAAVREASDGAAFLAEIAETLGLPMEAISGAEEARLSALGVAAGFHAPTGLIGDLGGSSLELAKLHDGWVEKGETHMLGPLAIMPGDPMDLDMPSLRQRVRKRLKQSDVLPGIGGRFFMVGGAWRALAKLHMDLDDYPLRQLHAYRLDRKAVALINEVALSTDAVARQRLAKASQRRVKVLPYAAIVLSEVFEIGGFEEIVVSSYGLREGVIQDQLAFDGPSDALLDGIALYLRLQEPRRAFGEALNTWVQPAMRVGQDLLGDTLVMPRLIAAACLLADSGARFHPDNRAYMAYDQALRGPYSNIGHAERAFIALAVGRRYARQFEPRARMEPLLSKHQVKMARQLGACMRLGTVYSGRSAQLLAKTRLYCEPGYLVFEVPESDRAMVSHAVERRLSTAADTLGLTPQIRNRSTAEATRSQTA